MLMTNIKKWASNGNWVELDLDLCAGSGECVEVCPACQGGCLYEAILNHFAWQ